MAAPQSPEPAPLWEPKRPGTDASFRGLHVVDDRVVWASGTGGTVVRTINGGSTWTVSSIDGAEGLDFRDIHAFGEMSAIVLSSGDVARFYMTTDGGRTWSVRYSNETKGVFFDALAFWDRDHGIAFSDPIEGHLLIVTTEDGGKTWNEVPREKIPPVLPGEAAFAASGTCLVVEGSSNVWIGTGGGEKARVFRSTDRGKSWSVAETPVRAGASSAGIFSLAFRDARNGVAVGGDYTKPTEAVESVAITSDGGKTWTLANGPLPSGYRSCVAYVPGTAGTLVAVGISGTDVSTDGGNSWQSLDSMNLNSVGFSPGKLAGWAVGPDATVVRLADPEALSAP